VSDRDRAKRWITITPSTSDRDAEIADHGMGGKWITEKAPLKSGLPKYVEQAFRAYLECGVFAHGFIRRNGGDCQRDLAALPGVKVLDFGISRLIADGEENPWSTRTGVSVGTPAYVAPEQFADASRAGPPADVYSLGASLFELLTTVAPAGANRARRLKDAAVPEVLATALLAAMAEEADARPEAVSLAQSLAAIADELGAPAPEEIARRSPPPSQVTRRSDEGAG
jgi:serine/threonine protein kinase